MTKLAVAYFVVVTFLLGMTIGFFLRDVVTEMNTPPVAEITYASARIDGVDLRIATSPMEVRFINSLEDIRRLGRVLIYLNRQDTKSELTAHIMEASRSFHNQDIQQAEAVIGDIIMQHHNGMVIIP